MAMLWIRKMEMLVTILTIMIFSVCAGNVLLESTFTWHNHSISLVLLSVRSSPNFELSYGTISVQNFRDRFLKFLLFSQEQLIDVSQLLYLTKPCYPKIYQRNCMPWKTLILQLQSLFIYAFNLLIFFNIMREKLEIIQI